MPERAAPAAGPTSVDPAPNLSAARVVVELLRIAQSLDHIHEMWQLAASGFRPEELGPSEAVLFNFRFWMPCDVGYSMPGGGVERYGEEPGHWKDFPEPLAILNVTWDEFRDADEAARLRAAFKEKTEAHRKYMSGLLGSRVGGDSEARAGVEVSAGDPAPHSHGDCTCGDCGHCDPQAVADDEGLSGWRELEELRRDWRPRPETSLMDYLHEHVEAAAALVPTEVVHAAVRPVVMDWIRWRIGDEYHRPYLSAYAAFLDLATDRDAALGLLADGYLAAESPTIKLWLLAYATLRETRHVCEGPELASDRRNQFFGDPKAVIWWPAEAFKELLIRLAPDAHQWAGTTASVPPPPPAVRRGNGGRSKSYPELDKKVREAAASGKYSELKVMAKAIGEDADDVRLAWDRLRKDGAKWVKPDPG